MAGGERVARLRTGLSTSYADHGAGDGVPVLLLHAWGESRRAFGPFVAHLPRGVRAVAPDQRGHGDAGKPRTGYTLPELAEDAAAFLDAIGVDDAVLVGASSGGYVAQQVAVAHPDRVAGLVLAGAPRSLRGRRPPFAAEIDSLTDPLDPAWVRSFTLGFTQADLLPDGFLDLLVEDALKIPAEVWRLSLDGLLLSAAPTEVGTVRAPTLVVSGARDALVGGDESRRLVEAIPGSRWIEYPDAGHAVLWEQPERLARDVAAFAGRLSRARSR
jgi:rifampin ADP-ribosylating transferase